MKIKKQLLATLIGGLIIAPLWGSAATVKKPPLPPLFTTDTNPEIIVTWKATNYAPANYKGKVIPTGQTPVVVSMAVLDNGTLADLQNSIVLWYINDELFKSGLNMHTITLSTQKFPGEKVFVRAEIQNYKNQDILKTAEIPTIPPEVVVEAPFPDRQTNARQIQLHATPYFFNVKNSTDLIYNWTINDQTAQANENPQDLFINMGATAQYPVQLEVTARAQDPRNTTLFNKALSKTTLTLQ